MLRANLNYSGRGGISWNEWVRRIERRADRAAMPMLPDTVTRAIWHAMAKWVEQNLFTGNATPRAQYDYWKDPPMPERIGMYGAGSAPAPDHIINAWEKLGGGHQVKGSISEHPQNANVLAAAGPGFLASMYGTGPVVDAGVGQATIGVHTLATMTPYDPSAGGTRPIMYYLKRGWIGDRAHMRPRWPNGVVPFMAGNRPYQPYLSLISRYVISGR